MYKDKMNIVFSVDDNFCPQLAVTIASILINSAKEDKFNFYILDGGISNENKQKISLLNKIKDFDLTFLKIDNVIFKDCPIYSHFKLPTYYRIKLPSLLALDKVLYLDCDIVVKSSLSELYAQNIETCYAAAVPDILQNLPHMVKHKKILGVSKYFNAGVMLLNLKKMRKDNIKTKCFDHIKNNPEKILYVDQCVLNFIFKENVLWLDDKWNFQHNFCFKQINEAYRKKRALIKILHFVTNEKPWLFNKSLSFIVMYYYYLLKTPFKSFLFKDLQKETIRRKNKFLKSLRQCYIIFKKG